MPRRGIRPGGGGGRDTSDSEPEPTEPQPRVPETDDSDTETGDQSGSVGVTPGAGGGSSGSSGGDAPSGTEPSPSEPEPDRPSGGSPDTRTPTAGGGGGGGGSTPEPDEPEPSEPSGAEQPSGTEPSGATPDSGGDVRGGQSTTTRPGTSEEAQPRVPDETTPARQRRVSEAQQPERTGQVAGQEPGVDAQRVETFENTQYSELSEGQIRNLQNQAAREADAGESVAVVPTASGTAAAVVTDDPEATTRRAFEQRLTNQIDSQTAADVDRGDVEVTRTDDGFEASVTEEFQKQQVTQSVDEQVPGVSVERDDFTITESGDVQLDEDVQSQLQTQAAASRIGGTTPGERAVVEANDPTVQAAAAIGGTTQTQRTQVAANDPAVRARSLVEGEPTPIDTEQATGDVSGEARPTSGDTANAPMQSSPLGAEMADTDEQVAELEVAIADSQAGVDVSEETRAQADGTPDLEPISAGDAAERATQPFQDAAATVQGKVVEPAADVAGDVADLAGRGAELAALSDPNVQSRGAGEIVDDAETAVGDLGRGTDAEQGDESLAETAAQGVSEGAGSAVPFLIQGPDTIREVTETTGEAGAFTYEQIEEQGVVEGGQTAAEAGVDVGVAAAERTIETAESNPYRTAGTLIGTAGVMGAARRIGPRTGAASRYAIQPVEEAAGLAGNRVLPGAVGNRLFPNNEPVIFSEEAAIRGARRARERLGQTGSNVRTLLASERGQGDLGQALATETEVDVETDATLGLEDEPDVNIDTGTEFDVDESFRRQPTRQAQDRISQRRAETRDLVEANRRRNDPQRREALQERLAEASGQFETETEAETRRQEAETPSLEQGSRSLVGRADAAIRGTELLETAQATEVGQRSAVDAMPRARTEPLSEPRGVTDTLTELDRRADSRIDTRTNVDVRTATEPVTATEVATRADARLQTEPANEMPNELEVASEFATETRLETEAFGDNRGQDSEQLDVAFDEDEEVFGTGFASVDELEEQFQGGAGSPESAADPADVDLPEPPSTDDLF